MNKKIESLCNPDFEPTDRQWRQVAEDALLVSKWRDAMADRGIRILATDMPYSEQMKEAKKWASQENKPD